MIIQVKKAVIATNPEYDIVFKKIHFCYDMKLVAFGIDDDSFPVFVQPYSQTPLTLYQMEKVPAPIIYQSTQANSYMELHILKPYSSLNKWT